MHIRDRQSTMDLYNHIDLVKNTHWMTRPGKSTCMDLGFGASRTSTCQLEQGKAVRGQDATLLSIASTQSVVLDACLGGTETHHLHNGPLVLANLTQGKNYSKLSHNTDSNTVNLTVNGGASIGIERISSLTSSVNVQPTLCNVDSNAVSRETNDRASTGTNKGKDIDTTRTDQVIYLGTFTKGEDFDTRIGLPTNNSSSVDQHNQHLLSISFLELSGMCKTRNLP